MTDVNTVIAGAQELGFLKDMDREAGQGRTAQQKNLETLRRLQEEESPLAEGFGTAAGFNRTSSAEKSRIKLEEAKRKGQITRDGAFMTEGLDAADSIPVIRRSIDLLDDIKTGGIQAGLLRAKQIFGVEGANEAELSANLGKNVLAQLKTSFLAPSSLRKRASG